MTVRGVDFIGSYIFPLPSFFLIILVILNAIGGHVNRIFLLSIIQLIKSNAKQ